MDWEPTCPICHETLEPGYSHAHKCDFCTEKTDYKSFLVDQHVRVADGRLMCAGCATYLSKRESYLNQTGQWDR